MLRKTLLICLIAVASLAVDGAEKGEPELKSGLQVGDLVGSFEVKDVTGPARGRELCYVCRYGGRPVVNIFVRKLTEDVAVLIKEIDEQVQKHQSRDLKAFVVLLSDDPRTDELALIRLTRKHKIRHVPLTIFEGHEGPQKCRLSEKADLTAVLWSDSEVRANHAFPRGKLKKRDVQAIVKSVGKIID